MKHKFSTHIVSSKTQILILGTFHPDENTGASFFYGRSRNYLWKILPTVMTGKNTDLKRASDEDKKKFMADYNIDFIDLVESADICANDKKNYSDLFLDKHIVKWKKITEEIDKLKDLKAVYFTRKTFIGIPKIEMKVSEIRNYCMNKKIRFCLLETPARYSNDSKIEKWRNTIVYQTTCL